jgi:hypothetical protein
MRAAFRLGTVLGLAMGLSWGLPAAPSGPVLPPKALRDSVRVPATNPSAAVQPPSDSTRNPTLGSAGNQASTAKPDSLSLRPKSRSDSVIVAKHQFNHQEQIITGSVIMTCLALMLVAMNNYNPR